jgi:hypothetical protein
MNVEKRFYIHLTALLHLLGFGARFIGDQAHSIISVYFPPYFSLQA